MQYLAVAEEIRKAILAGDYPPGSSLPSERRLYTEHRCGLDTVREALDVLRGEGLIIKQRGLHTRVTPVTDRIPVPLQAGTVVGARMPLRPETAVLDCRPEVPLLTVTTSNGKQSLHPADRVLLVA